METSTCKNRGASNEGPSAVIKLPKQWGGIVARCVGEDYEELKRQGWLTCADFAHVLGIKRRSALDRLHDLVERGSVETEEHVITCNGQRRQHILYRPAQEHP